ncbi:MAG TPA: PTS sugar transporter subunit IIA [Gemmatimonadales bacterium]|jgi:mannitol/fructose-specific phosphotransferase system IIA component (Ntr-type)|nr:PTS sugar transporter subunit IIA [Gemmatimonadales bacterium]
MRLADFLSPDAISLDLQAGARDSVLPELVGLLKLHGRTEETLLRLLRRREDHGSTGVGRGIAIPHCRSTEVSRVRLAFGRSVRGIDYRSLDGAPVHAFFLIIAPPAETVPQYLPLLGKIAALGREPDVPARLMAATTAEELFKLFEEKGV